MLKHVWPCFTLRYDVSMHFTRITIVSLGLVLILQPVSLAVEFAASPNLSRRGDEVVVTFTLDKRADVEVAVLDTTNRVVRHLAAGMLGADTVPPRPLQCGLSQTLVWDGKDDAGKPIRRGPFRIRVRAGMTPTFGRMIGGSPYTGGVTSMPYRAPVNGPSM